MVQKIISSFSHEIFLPGTNLGGGLCPLELGLFEEPMLTTAIICLLEC